MTPVSQRAIDAVARSATEGLRLTLRNRLERQRRRHPPRVTPLRCHSGEMSRPNLGPSDSPPNADSVAGFDRTIPLAVEVLEHRARDVESVAGAGDDTAVLKAYAAARFFIVQIDVDMRVLLRAMAADPTARVTTEKLLALVLRESIEGVYRVLGDLQRTARTQAGRFADFVEVDQLTAAQDAYKRNIRDIAEDRPFKETLVKIRNEVAAHMFSDEVGIESAAAWVVSRSVMPKTDDAMFNSLIFSRSIQVLRALHTLDEALASIRRM